MIKRIIRHIDWRVGNYLRSRYSSFNVTRPYVLQIDDHQGLNGKIAVITGGSGAIGRACAVRLAAEGAKVYVCGSKPDSANSVVSEIRSLGLKAEGVQVNVLDDNSIKEKFEKIATENGGHFDILVNSAGGSARDDSSNIANQKTEVIDNVLNINLRGAILCSKYASQYMIKHRYGRIINITSVIGIQGKAGFSEYAASKGGSIAFVKSLAQELGQFGITVNSVAPGIVQRGEIAPLEMDYLTKTNWIGTFGKPEDISATVNFLCKAEASFITGQNIAVDGGRSLGLKEN